VKVSSSISAGKYQGRGSRKDAGNKSQKRFARGHSDTADTGEEIKKFNHEPHELLVFRRKDIKEGVRAKARRRKDKIDEETHTETQRNGGHSGKRGLTFLRFLVQ